MKQQECGKECIVQTLENSLAQFKELVQRGVLFSWNFFWGKMTSNFEFRLFLKSYSVIFSLLKFERERFPLFVPMRSFVPAPFWTSHERFRQTWKLRNGHETFRNVQGRSRMVNGQGRRTVWNVHTVQDKRCETFGKSPSW